MQYIVPEPALCKKRMRAPRTKMPVGIDLTNATILAIDPGGRAGGRDILYGIFHTLSGDVETALDNRIFFRLSKDHHRTECGI